MLAEQYLNRRYRADTFLNFQTPVYFLGKRGWHVVGKPMNAYNDYRMQIEQRAERTFQHTLSVHDVTLKFVLESEVKRIISSEDKLWQEAVDFGNIPDSWIQFGGGEAFIEVDRATERPIVLKEKLDRYIAFKESGRYRQQFPGCDFKVLVITTSENRIESLERRIWDPDIWFSTMDEFLTENLNHQHWLALHGFHALPVTTKKEVQDL
jgi:hypothetical protein